MGSGGADGDRRENTRSLVLRRDKEGKFDLDVVRGEPDGDVIQERCQRRNIPNFVIWNSDTGLQVIVAPHQANKSEVHSPEQLKYISEVIPYI